jgi:hypothetical protein
MYKSGKLKGLPVEIVAINASIYIYIYIHMVFYKAVSPTSVV